MSVRLASSIKQRKVEIAYDIRTYSERLYGCTLYSVESGPYLFALFFLLSRPMLKIRIVTPI